LVWVGVGGAFVLNPHLLWISGPLPKRNLWTFSTLQGLNIANDSTIQPLTYFQLVFATVVGIWAFNDVIDQFVVLVASIVVFAGPYTLWRDHKQH